LVKENRPFLNLVGEVFFYAITALSPSLQKISHHRIIYPLPVRYSFVMVQVELWQVFRASRWKSDL